MNKILIRAAALCFVGVLAAGCKFEPDGLRFVRTYENKSMTLFGANIDSPKVPIESAYLLPADEVDDLVTETKKKGANFFLEVCPLVPHDGGGYQAGSDCEMH